MLRLRARESLDQPIRRASAPEAFLREEAPAGQAAKFLRFSMIANSAIATDANKPPKKLINSNVAIELGYALRALGSQGILMVMNDFYGGRADLPFDLQARAGPMLFNLPPDADIEIRTLEKARLKSQLKGALRLCIEEHARSIDVAKAVESEPQGPRITSGDWERLSQRLLQGCQFLRADSQKDSAWPTEHWRIAGGQSSLCESLLRKAGAMLLTSPNVRANLPDFVAQEPDPLVRWLSFLKHRGYYRVAGFYNQVDDEGTSRFGGVIGSIHELGHSSLVVCEECSASEL
jgi:hypothetical protein